MWKVKALNNSKTEQKSETFENFIPLNLISWDYIISRDSNKIFKTFQVFALSLAILSTPRTENDTFSEVLKCHLRKLLDKLTIIIIKKTCITYCSLRYKNMPWAYAIWLDSNHFIPFSRQNRNRPRTLTNLATSLGILVCVIMHG